MASIPDRQWSSIGVEKAMFNELKTLKVQAEERAGRRLTWADFFAILMGLHEMRSVAIPAEQVPVAHMHQEKPGEEPLSPEQLEEMGLEEISFLNERDREFIADRVAEKVIQFLKESLPILREE